MPWGKGCRNDVQKTGNIYSTSVLRIEHVAVSVCAGPVDQLQGERFLGETVMARNTKQTSAKVASTASATLHDKGASTLAKRLAASALAQTGTGKQTGAVMEDVAARALASEKTSAQTKSLAATVLAQANKAR